MNKLSGKKESRSSGYALDGAKSNSIHLLDATGQPFWIIETDDNLSSQKTYDTTRKDDQGKTESIAFNRKIMLAEWGQYIPGLKLSHQDQPKASVFECETVSDIDVYLIEKDDQSYRCSPLEKVGMTTISLTIRGDNPTFAALVGGTPISLNQGDSQTITVPTMNDQVTVEDWHRSTSILCPIVNNNVSIEIESFSAVSCGTASPREDSSSISQNDRNNDTDQGPTEPQIGDQDDESEDDLAVPPAMVPNHDNVVIGYYESWAQWRQNLDDGYKSAMEPKDIDPSLFTHIYFAFMSFGFEIFDRDSTGTVTAKNPHNTGDYRIKEWEDNDIKRLNELKSLKSKNPELKLVVSLGGWNFNLPENEAASSPYIYSDQTNYLFSDMISDVSVAHNQKSSAADRVPCTGLLRDSGTCVALRDNAGQPTTSRKQFIASVIDFLRTNELDGIDLDWEYPGDLTRGGRCEDFNNYGMLLKEMHEAFVAEADATNRDKLLLTMATSAAIPSGVCADYQDSAKYFGAYAGYAKYLDWIGVMTYDYYGSWTGKTGPNAPPQAVIDPNTNQEITKDFNGTASMEKYLAAGVPSSKLVLGMGTYGRNFSEVQFDGGGTFDGFGSGLTANGSGFMGAATGEKGLSTYFEILNLQKTASWKTSFDTETQTPFMYNENQGLWIGFDNEESLEVKCDMIQKLRLRGGMIWSITNDDHQGTYSETTFPLIRSIHSCLRN